jgi:NADPH-dependent glutamate synthase beta subunit-like oxidoreductase/Pyruvate/2-oxoacid:ferredoxin oxidoreductase delta subunit
MKSSDEAVLVVETSPFRPRWVEKTAPCVSRCPNGIAVRDWITSIAQAEACGRTEAETLELAWWRIMDLNPFPAVCGRVCPHPCETGCNRKEKDGSVAINALERFVGDFGISRRLRPQKLSEERRQDRVAIVGAGPAGLSCAYQLSRRGYPVTVFDAFSEPGGMLRYGIPAFRLPREVLDAEIQNILNLGVELQSRMTVGKDISFTRLRENFSAVFVGIGTHKGRSLGIPGEDAGNVMSGIEFLHRVNSGTPPQVGNRVIVIGGGDTAIDAARVSRRLGAEVTVLYRRTREDMPAIAQEIDAAMEEGIVIESLMAPVEILQADGRATGLKCVRMEAGPPDDSGRPRPMPITGSGFEMNASTIIAAVSQEPDFTPFAELYTGTGGIPTDEWGATGTRGVYAGGDAVEPAYAITAVYQGRMAARAIDAHLRGEVPAMEAEHPPADEVLAGWYKEAGRHERHRTPVARRSMTEEVEQELTVDGALEEAQRCMACGMCMDCETCWMYCANNCFVRLPKGEHYSIRMELCNGCKKCAEGCPSGYLELYLPTPSEPGNP